MKKRYQIRIDLSPATGRALERLSIVTGESVPKLTARFLDEAGDAFHLMAEALEAATEVQRTARRHYLAGFEEAAAEAQDLASAMKWLFSDMAEGKLGAPARGRDARGRARGR